MNALGVSIGKQSCYRLIFELHLKGQGSNLGSLRILSVERAQATRVAAMAPPAVGLRQRTLA
jgi:hypothetical protein